MIRNIIKINEEKCIGCGKCASACHEGAIEMVNGKAKLTREHYCDGLGDCLPACPTDAITFEEREAPAYDEAAVLASKREQAASSSQCPGTQAKALADCDEAASVPSRLENWPVQLKLVPPTAPYFDGCELLIAADCTAYAYGNFHRDFAAGRITLIGCPKLDAFDYAEKLTAILYHNNIRSLTLTRMMVPCCGGMERAVLTAMKNSKKQIPCRIVTIDASGNIINEKRG